MESILGINRAYAKLTKIGYGHSPKLIQGGYPVENNLTYSVTGIGELTFSDISIPEVATNGIYPSDNLYPSNSLYPSNAPYTYLLYQFLLYEWDGTNRTYTGENYIQAFPLEKDGTISIKVKYERG